MNMIIGSKLTLEGYVIPKNKLTDKQLNFIKKDLTVTPLNSDFAKEGDTSTKYKVYKTDKDNVIIPRYYGIDKFGPAESDDFDPKKAKIVFTGNLRDYQKEIIDTCMKHVKKRGGGMLVVPCGHGKTTMAIYMASLLGVKTLIVTHKTFLQDQWIDRCKQFTKSKVGTIRQDTIDVKGKDFVVAMVQSLSRRDYDPEIFKEYGLLIVDEAHHFSSKHFSKALSY
jgi:superfamily II DNA or RNA helicase